MRRTLIASTLTIALGVPLAVQAAPAACSAASQGNRVPLVELYTAEGCSDCPPADKWLSGLAKSQDPSLTATLAFHVDYWDEIGWVDRFALPLNSQRQKARIGWAKSNALVTPSVMIGEKVMVKWRSGTAVSSLLEATRSQPAPVSLALEATRDGSKVHVAFQAKPGAAASTAPAYVWLALYQDGLSSSVRAGENKGKVLTHDRVVRALQGPWKLGDKAIAGDADLAMPEGADAAQVGLVLFAESPSNGAGLQALNLPLAQCGG